MGIPILDEIFQGIRWAIDFFVNKAPKPVQIAFFLIMLLLFSVLINFMFHLFGIHCNSANEVVKTSPLSLASNIRIAFMDKDDSYNKTAFLPPNIEFGLFGSLGAESCRKPICLADDGNYYWQTSANCINKTIIYPYLSKQFKWSRCVDCSGDTNFTVILGIMEEREHLCFGDATRIEDTSWIQGLLCDPESRCIPYENYYYEYDNGMYICTDNDICGVNITNESLRVSELDEKLKSMDAELLYKTDSRNYKNVFVFKCSTDSKPSLTFFGVPFLDYKIWLILIIIAIMFIFLTKIIKN